MFSFPPIVQRFLRGKTWWHVIRYSPGDLGKFLTHKHPLIGIGVVTYGYFYFWSNPLKQAEEDRFSRFRDNWRAEVHYQEALDWESKKNRDDMRSFVEAQTEKYGSLDKAVQAYESRSGKTAPPLVLNDPVYDYTFKRIGVPVKGDEEPHFLWDGTAYLSEKDKPPTFSDGKIRLPESPRLYLE
mmetsp:Transcript_56447/g.50781  ORF Transcript_56447/g.50781 Transcript_56447/m.50781 type:complete len:184 (+) Transcript_56447:59-610(+)